MVNYKDLGIHENFSWDYITQAQYIPDCEETEVYDINFEDYGK